MTYAPFRTLSFIAAFWPAAHACAQGSWQFFDLHPTGAASSEISGGGDGQFVGGAHFSGEPGLRAFLWDRSGQPTQLSAGVPESASALGAGGGLQGGQFNGRAALWSGTPESRVDLHPLSNPLGSWIWGTTANQQVGSTVNPPFPYRSRAALWSGTAESFVDLHPTGAAESFAYATDGEYQGGYAQYTGFHQAMLWHGSAASAVLLGPSFGASEVRGMVPGQQVGFAETPTGAHAVLWRGTPESLTDLHPPGVPGVSELHATCGSAQVGLAPSLEFGNTAAIWFGTAESCTPLAPFVPAGYANASPSAVWFDGSRYFVAGTVNVESTTHAFLMVGIPAPSSAAALALASLFAARRRRA
jgi:hypothetical protein